MIQLDNSYLLKGLSNPSGFDKLVFELRNNSTLTTCWVSCIHPIRYFSNISHSTESVKVFLFSEEEEINFPELNLIEKSKNNRLLLVSPGGEISLVHCGTILIGKEDVGYEKVNF